MPKPSPSKLLPALASAAFLGLAPTGCLGAIIADGQISATRDVAGVFNQIADYELARAAAAGGIVQFEGMHKLRPDNEDALYLLTQAWAAYGFGFPQEDYEDAIDRNDDEAAEYQKNRATLAYDRAIFFGLELLSHRDKGFAVARKNDDTLKKWLADNFTSKSDAENLFWLGYAWIAKVNLNKSAPEIVADLYIPIAMLERSLALDPALQHYSGAVILAAYHARPAGEMDQSKQMFEDVLAKTQRKNLLAEVAYAQSYACTKGDRALYDQLLNEVLTAQDPDPDQRLANLVAKREAKRWQGKQRMFDCGFDTSSHAAPKAAKP
jgi:hypothetical protein